MKRIYLNTLVVTPRFDGNRKCRVVGFHKRCAILVAANQTSDFANRFMQFTSLLKVA